MRAVALDLETARTTGDKEVVREVAVVDGEEERTWFPLDSRSDLVEVQDAIAGRLVLAYGAEGDVATLRRWARRVGVPFREPACSCLLQAARKRWPRLKSYKLAKACAAVGIDVSTFVPHVALDDARMAWLLYRRMGAAGVAPGSRRGWVRG